MNYKQELNERYKQIYIVLTGVHLGSSACLMDTLRDARHELEVKAALDFVLEKKWIGNLDEMEEHLNGDYSVTFNKEPFVTTDGLRYINFYEKYKDKGLDIISMTLGDSQLVEYYAKRDRFSTFTSIIVDVFLIVVTALVTHFVPSLLSKLF